MTAAALLARIDALIADARDAGPWPRVHDIALLRALRVAVEALAAIHDPKPNRDSDPDRAMFALAEIARLMEVTT